MTRDDEGLRGPSDRRCVRMPQVRVAHALDDTVQGSWQRRLDLADRVLMVASEW
jgi:hypothetical protein